MSDRPVIPAEPAVEEFGNALAILEAVEQVGDLKGAAPAVVEAWHAVAARLRVGIAKLRAQPCPCQQGAPELCDVHQRGRL